MRAKKRSIIVTLPVKGENMVLTKIKHLIVPQDSIFFDLLQKQAETAHNAAQSLAKRLEASNEPEVQAESVRIRELEHQGDQLMREIYTALNKTFIVPIDHADISTLANALDDIIDLIDQVSILMTAYEITEPSPPMIKLAKLLVEQTNELKIAVPSITHSRTYGKVAEHCKKIKQLENKADEEYIQAITALFKKADAKEILRQKEILECLESATDKTDRAAQHISDIIMKHS